MHPPIPMLILITINDGKTVEVSNACKHAFEVVKNATVLRSVAETHKVCGTGRRAFIALVDCRAPLTYPPGIKPRRGHEMDAPQVMRQETFTSVGPERDRQKKKRR